MSVTIRGRDYRDGQPIELEVEGAKVAATRLLPGAKEAAAPSSAIGGHNAWIAPGLVDVQVNGFAGYDLNGPAATPEDVEGMVRGLWKAGVTLSCPTVTTGSSERMSRSIRAIAQACDESAVARRGLARIHVEGPYISPDDGPRGAHPREHVRPPDWDEFCRFQEAAGGRIGIITLAPEAPGAAPFIEKVVAEGVVAALGHHNGTKADIDAAVAAGATFITHLGNGSHALLPRHPNYIWEQLANDRLHAGVIIDGHHVPASVVKCFVRVKGVERIVLVSDAVRVAGLPPGRYKAIGAEVELSPEGRVSLLGTPYLAGSALELCQGLAKVVAFAGVTLSEAVTMSVSNPASLVGAESSLGGLDLGDTANLIVFEWEPGDLGVRLLATVSQGEVVYSRSEP